MELITSSDEFDKVLVVELLFIDVQRKIKFLWFRNLSTNRPPEIFRLHSGEM